MALKIVIPPNHSTYISVYYYSGDPDPNFSTDRRTLVELVEKSNSEHPDAPPAEIWDFNDYNELCSEPLPTTPEGRMHWFPDGTHARKALGRCDAGPDHGLADRRPRQGLRREAHEGESAGPGWMA